MKHCYMTYVLHTNKGLDKNNIRLALYYTHVPQAQLASS